MVGSSTHFLRVYFNFGYYLSLVPFRFHRNKANDKAIVKNSSKIKTIICFLVHTLICCGYSVRTIREFQQKATQQIDFYFFVLWKSFSVLYMMAFFETVWRHSAHFLNILIQLDKEEEVISKNKLPFYVYGDQVFEPARIRKKLDLRPSARLFATILCILYTVPSFVIVFSAQLFSETPTWDVYTNIYLYCLKAKEMIFFQNIAPEAYKHENIPNRMSNGDYAIGLFYGVFQFFNYLRDYYSDLLLLTCVFTMRNLSRRFRRFLKNNSHAAPAEVCRKYNLVRDISTQINEIMRISFGLVVLQVPYMFVDTVTREHQTVLSFLYGVIFTITFFVILCTAAAVVDDMRSIKSWIRNGNSSKLSTSPELLLVLEEADHSPFGVKGIGLPVMTYGFVRIIVTIMATYGILMIQLAPSQCECTCLIANQPVTEITPFNQYLSRNHLISTH